MWAVSADSVVPEFTLDTFDISEGLKRTNLRDNWFLEKFAQNMADNIIQSFIGQMEMVESEVDCWESTFDQNQATIAEELASAVLEVALREVCSGQQMDDRQEDLKNSKSARLKWDGGHRAKNMSFMDESDSEEDFLDMDPELEHEIQTSNAPEASNPPLSQSSLPVIGSLDYPNTPPTTPLLPELERSRHSFAKKLKGSLAKVFLPSPSTIPKEEEPGAVHNPPVELMEHLLTLLCSEDLARDHFEAQDQHGAKTKAFAEALSCDIIDWVLSDQNREQNVADSDLNMPPQKLAETMIT